MAEKIVVFNVLKGVRKRLKLILGITFLSISSVWLFMVFILTEDFQATSQILVEDTEESPSPSGELSSRPDPQLIETYSALITSNDVLKKVLAETGMQFSVNELYEKIIVSHIADSQVINITVADKESETAAEIANALAYTSQEEMKVLMEVENISIIAAAAEKEYPSPLMEAFIYSLGIGGIFGLIVGSLLAFILEMMNTLFQAGVQERRRKGERLQTVFK